jgi:serine/threonine protein kinase/formylglycine-generating enzyme required for sulfatase activity
MSDDPLLNKGQLGPYRIEKKLGQGAMGGVYLGMHGVLEVHHAIKVIHPKLLGDETLLERFLREARNTAKMKHANIVQVVGADKVDGSYYLAMEFVQGKTLDQLMRNPGLSIHDAVRYIHMIANALQYAHSRNIIHRDIKPANIMVNEEDVAKLMDFGLVRDQGQAEGPESGEQLTMAGYIMGTPQYMPLEQWQGEGVDHRSDIYALGSTLYVALTGKLPFPGKDAREIFRKVLTTEAVDVRTHNPDVDDQLAEIVHRAIAPEKDDRFQTAAEVALALEAWWDLHPYQGTSLFKAPVLDDARTGARGTLSSSSVSAARTKAPSTNTRAILTRGATGQGSTPASMDAVKKSNAPLLVGIALLVIIGLAVGGWIVFGGKEEVAPPAPVFKVDIAADKATQALPLAVTNTDFSIPGEGDATVNGEAYTFGAALKLKPGLNELAVASAAGSGERKLYVLFDASAPVLAVPELEGRQGNIIPVDAGVFKVAGTVSDEGCGLRDLKLMLRIDGDERLLVVSEKGEFERELPVGDADITLELQAEDRAGNRSKALTFWVVPDRTTLGFEDAWQPANGWVTTTSFELKGKLNKQRGAKLTVDGKEVSVGEYGNFTATLEREAGRHTIECVAEDWLGGKQTSGRQIVVDLEPPLVEVTAPAPGEKSFEKLPATIDVAGKVDSTDVELSVNGRQVKPATDGSFKTQLTVEAYGELVVDVQATDPAGRTTGKSVKLSVKPLLYKLVGKNDKGYREFERLKDGMVMIEIPGGKFTRGIGAEVLGDAERREIELSSFLIAKYETTNGQFAKFLTASQVTSAEAIERGWLVKNDEGRFSGLQPAGKEWAPAAGEGNLPVAGVTWLGAQAYCQWADEGGSLPSEAQWEYAARGADGRQFPWGNGDVSTKLANTEITGREATTDVTKLADGDSPFGVRMMAGNVEEWCLDWYLEGAYKLPDQQGKDSALTTRPDGSDRRVVRGGSFLSPYRKKPAESGEDEPGNLQSYARARRLPDTGSADRGFRAAAKVPK